MSATRIGNCNKKKGVKNKEINWKWEAKDSTRFLTPLKMFLNQFHPAQDFSLVYYNITLPFVYLSSKRPVCKRFLHSKFVISLPSAHYNVLYSTNLILTLHELYKLPASTKFTSYFRIVQKCRPFRAKKQDPPMRSGISFKFNIARRKYIKTC
jgi:hypothetical protein